MLINIYFKNCPSIAINCIKSVLKQQNISFEDTNDASKCDFYLKKMSKEQTAVFIAEHKWDYWCKYYIF